MSQYYKTQFPAAEVFAFCTLHHETKPQNREVAVTFANDVWRRYNSVHTAEELRALAVGAGAGATLHLGPHYSEAASLARKARLAKAEDKNGDLGTGMRALGKQLPFDLDLTDLAFLKIDKSNQSANDRYVRLVFGQVHILRAILHEVFGFEHFLPVYSGRRGAHLWVLDKRADALTDEARKAVASMIAPPPSKRDDRLFNRRAIEEHASFLGDEVKAAVEEVLERIVFGKFSSGGIGLLDTKMRVADFVDRLFDVAKPADSKWQADADAAEAFFRSEVVSRNVYGPGAFDRMLEILESALPTVPDAKLTPRQVAIRAIGEKLHDVVFSLVWPCLDVGPSAQMGHCVKIPFSEHGKTGRISLPLDNLLPTPGAPALPPVITSADLLLDPGPKSNQFLRAAALLKAAVAAARRGTAPPPSCDIEDLMGPNKRARV